MVHSEEERVVRRSYLRLGDGFKRAGNVDMTLSAPPVEEGDGFVLKGDEPWMEDYRKAVERSGEESGEQSR